MRAGRRTLLLPVLLAAACGGGDGPPAAGAGEPRVERCGGRTMGSTWEVKFVGDVPVAHVRDLVERELAAFDETFSNWRPDSEIARVNAHASSDPLPVSRRFAAVLQLALDVAAATDGAFDPTVKPLSDVFRAAKQDPEHRLDPDVLAAAAARVGHGLVALRDGAVVKQRADLQLDLDGVVAGAAADAIAALLAPLALRGLYVEITGEIVCRGEKAPAQPWVIGVVDPRSDAAGGAAPIRTLPLRDLALCTSGDYRNAFAAAGGVVHHVFDPRTGRSASTGVVSASVLARSAAVADALGTAMLVLGADDARRLWPRVQRLGATGALLLEAKDGALRAVEIAWPEHGS